jgi:hypothetical protein
VKWATPGGLIAATLWLFQKWTFCSPVRGDGYCNYIDYLDFKDCFFEIMLIDLPLAYAYNRSNPLPFLQ